MLTEKLLNVDAHSLIIKRASCAEPLQTLMNKISGIRKFDKACVMQVFDPKAIATRKHLIASYINARISFSEKVSRASDLSVEMLLFAAMTRQISAAIKMAGAKSNEDFVLFTDSAPAFKALKGHLKKVSEFNPSGKETMAAARRLGIKVRDPKGIEDAVLQKIALSRLEQ